MVLNHIHKNVAQIDKGWAKIKWPIEMFAYLSIPEAGILLVLPQGYRLSSVGLGIVAYAFLVAISWWRGRRD